MPEYTPNPKQQLGRWVERKVDEHMRLSGFDALPIGGQLRESLLFINAISPVDSSYERFIDRAYRKIDRDGDENWELIQVKSSCGLIRHGHFCVQIREPQMRRYVHSALRIKEYLENVAPAGELLFPFGTSARLFVGHSDGLFSADLIDLDRTNACFESATYPGYVKIRVDLFERVARWSIDEQSDFELLCDEVRHSARRADKERNGQMRLPYCE